MKESYGRKEILAILRKELEEGVYKRDRKMPGEHKMAQRFHTVPRDIRGFYEQLEREGYLYSLQGYGCYFAGTRQKIKLTLNDESFSKKMEKEHLDFQVKNISCQKLRRDSLISSMLEVQPDEPIYKITRLRCFQGEPVAIHTNYVTEDLFPRIEEESGGITSFYEYLTENGIRNIRSRDVQMTVSTMQERERELLKVKGKIPSLILTERCISEPSDMVICVARTVYRGDKFTFEL